jgi:N-acyl-D-aspartate/D-glutamate deacylase
MIVKKIVSCLVFCLFIAASTFSVDTRPDSGLRSNDVNVHAFVGATIVVSPGETFEQGTLVIRDGVIEAVGKSVEPPADARIWDCEGLTLYPGFHRTIYPFGFSKRF